MSDTDLGISPVVPPDPLGQAGGVRRTITDKITHGPNLQRAARDFESIFLHKIMEEMRRTVPESDLLDSGMGDQVQGMFWFYLAQDMADKGGLGLWKELARQVQQMTGDPSPQPKVEVHA
jgi:flagellar protein FlgJ